MTRLSLCLLPLVLTLLVFTGCADNKDSPSLPSVTPVDGAGNSIPIFTQNANNVGAHGLWGFWEIRISEDDLDVGSIQSHHPADRSDE